MRRPLAVMFNLVICLLLGTTSPRMVFAATFRISSPGTYSSGQLAERI